MTPLSDPLCVPAFGTLTRLALGVVGAVLLSGFLVAMSIEPDPRGFGTHQQLGLPPCTFQSRVGLPCPSCGMTTSFAHFVRGQWWAACHASVSGFVLALECSFGLVWCWCSSWQQRWCWFQRPEKVVSTLAAILFFVCLVDWCCRLILISNSN